MDKDIIEKFDYDGEAASKSESKGVKRGIKPSQIYSEQLLCLCSLVVIAFWSGGPRVLVMTAVSVLGAVLMDMAGCALSKKTYNPKDLSTVTAGMCVALLMPAGISYFMAFSGSALTIGIKHIFGGKDNYIFNPTAVAFAFLVICYPGKMLMFPKPREHLPVFGGIDSVAFSSFDKNRVIEPFDILTGNFAGAMGTVHILVLLVCAVCLMIRRSASPTVTLSALFASGLFSGVLAPGGGIAGPLLMMLVSGYFLFILIFLANDPQTLPKTFLGKIYYGALFGLAAAFFGKFGKVDGSPAFALLFVNTMTERSDILAGQTISGIKHAAVFVKNRLNSYETIRERAKTENEAKMRPGLSDTQEIMIVRQNYNMPPIDGKVTRINRKKQGLTARLREKIGMAAEKRKLNEEEKKEKPDINFFENLREGVKELGDAFKKKEEIPETPEPETDLTPLRLSLMLDDDDVVVIGASEKEEEPEIIDEEEKAGGGAEFAEAPEKPEGAKDGK
ncbi:MAG: RnfABCDGE type electron transport complex subunit D [Oscillospiraceae bacterium]|jgi:electron transport complex protein RnfD|nr:RnfABCDGE type electron transport complex subunit D [Oscillospiraceae bacterium]